MGAIARLRNVQCLRACAAALVIGVHEPDFERHLFGSSLLAPLRVPGGTGVDLFFAISGFIMVATTWNAFGGTRAARGFLARRIERIYPLYWVMTFAYLASHAALAGGLGAGFTTPREIVLSLLLIPHGRDPVLTVGWTLQYEMAFYLVFAGALVLARRRLPLVLAGWALVVLLCAALDARAPGSLLGFAGSPLNLEFLLGAAVGGLAMSGRLVAPATALAAGAAGVAAVFLYTSPLPALPGPWFRALAVAPPMALLLYGAVGLETRFGRAGPRALAALGDASYSLYLSHPLVLSTVAWLAARAHPHGPAAQVAFVLVTYAACVGTALLLYRWVERPLLGAAARLRGRPEPSTAARPGQPSTAAHRPEPATSARPSEPAAAQLSEPAVERT